MMSFTSTVPAAVPSLFQSSRPLRSVAGREIERRRPGSRRPVGFEELSPGPMSFTSEVPRRSRRSSRARGRSRRTPPLRSRASRRSDTRGDGAQSCPCPGTGPSPSRVPAGVPSLVHSSWPELGLATARSTRAPFAFVMSSTIPKSLFGDVPMSFTRYAGPDRRARAPRTAGRRARDALSQASFTLAFFPRSRRWCQARATGCSRVSCPVPEDPRMKFGVAFANIGPFVRPEEAVFLAQHL